MTRIAANALVRDPEDSQSASYLELFFDLASIFALTRLSRYLLMHPSPHGVLRTLTLLAALWWVSNVTAWSTGWFHPAIG